MSYLIQSGAYKGSSLEEVALGKRIASSGEEGYRYFNLLAKGDSTNFDFFQSNEEAMGLWKKIYTKLNNFKSIYPCLMCGSDSPTMVHLSKYSEFGHGMGSRSVCCNHKPCRDTVISRYRNSQIYPLGFDTILKFRYTVGDNKRSERELTFLMLDIAGWKNGTIMNPENASSFIEHIKTRPSLAAK